MCGTGNSVRIQIWIGIYQVSGPKSGFGIRIQKGKNDQQKIKKFNFLKCWIMDVLF
jgi:hypothetical protein